MLPQVQIPKLDPSCDAAHPRVILFEDIQAATGRISDVIIKTPCEMAKMSKKYDMNIYLKKEFLQITGCFKERGVRNALLLLPEAIKKNGVAAATIGNHGIALSYHCSLLGIPCVLVMPEGVAINKSNKCLDFGARVIFFGHSFEEARTHALTISEDKGMAYISGFDQPHVIQGQGSVGIEILEQIPDVDAILVPVGGGGLLAGVAVAAKYLKPETEIYGIETNLTCNMRETLTLGRVTISCEIGGTLADSLVLNPVGVNSVHNIKDNIEKMVVVQEDWVARAILLMAEEEKSVVEGGGAVSVAAIMAGKFSNLKKKTVVCIITGGNVDSTVLIRVLQRGMAAEGRLLKFKVTVPDRPGEIAMICAYLARAGVVMRDCVPKRTWFRGDVFNLELQIIVETKNWDHARDLVAVLRKHYNTCYFLQVGDRFLRTDRRSVCLSQDPPCLHQKTEPHQKIDQYQEQEATDPNIIEIETETETDDL